MSRQRFVLNISSLTLLGWHAGNLLGPARVVDGDTIVVADEKIRLHGIDAPEIGQTFWCDGREFDCGAMAAAALEALVAGIRVRCEALERDCYGRLVAKCYSPRGVDICGRLVRSGWALAYRHYSLDYVAAENEARENFRGLWRGSFDKPWEWRSRLARSCRGELQAIPEPATQR